MNLNKRPAAGLVNLRDALAAEVSQYHGLLILSRRQNRFMRHLALPELEALTREWEERRPRADGVRCRRLEAQEGAARGMNMPSDTPLSKIVRQGGGMAEELKSLSRSHRKALTALERQNTLNNRLARFCLDLVAGEADALRNGMNSTAGGTYDDRGAMANGQGSVVVRKA